jgi:hypothetical protein
MAAAISVSTVRSEPIPEMSRLLAAISWAESRDNDSAIGAAGERGRFQFMRETWEDVNAWRSNHSRNSFGFYLAFSPKAANVVAEDYINWILLRHNPKDLLHLIARWRKPSTGRITPETIKLYNRVRAALKRQEKSAVKCETYTSPSGIRMNVVPNKLQGGIK